jgi:DNA-binding MarR family transcriptional regulator
VGEDVIAGLERALLRVARGVGRLSLPGSAAGVTVERATYWVLGRVAEHGPIRASDLAALLSVDTSTISRQSHRLVAEGLLARTADPADARACLLKVTPRGRRVLVAVESFRRRQLAELLASWSKADVALLSTVLDRLGDQMDHAGLREASSSSSTPEGLPREASKG